MHEEAGFIDVDGHRVRRRRTGPDTGAVPLRSRRLRGGPGTGHDDLEPRAGLGSRPPGRAAS